MKEAKTTSKKNKFNNSSNLKEKSKKTNSLTKSKKGDFNMKSQNLFNTIIKSVMILFFLVVSFRGAFAQSTQTWANTYAGPGVSWDVANFVTVDASGNVYVTGGSHGGFATGLDFCTIKYSNTGSTIWTARYDGPHHGIDEAKKVLVDASGNVYVVGTVDDGPPYGIDYGLVKYSSSGAQVWVKSYNNSATVSGHDYCYDMVLDDLGNIYLTGGSESGSMGTGFDYATVKFDAGGTMLWANRYDGPSHTDDIAYAIAEDPNSREVVVTGYSDGGSSTARDFETIKYSPSGALLWGVRYDGPAHNNDVANAIVIDNASNVYVTGGSLGISTGFDYATVKYSSTGAQLWVARYTGSGGSLDDISTAIAVDASGNVYVTGRSGVSSGVFNYATIKYNSAGVQQWVATYSGFGFDNEANAIKVDGLGNVYVTGESFSPASHYDYATVKYNSAGVQQWVMRFDGAGMGPDFATSIALDAAGDVFVTGGSLSSIPGIGSPNFDYVTIKYTQTILGISENHSNPDKFSLSQNYPNPFNPSTNIKFTIAKTEAVKLVVYDITGKAVSTLVNEVKNAGDYEIRFDASSLASGVYYYKLESASYTDVKKMILIK